MLVQDLIDSVSFDDVAPHLVILDPYSEKDLDSFRTHFEILRTLTPKYNNDICIIKMEEDVLTSEICLNAYPLYGADWEEVLGMNVKIEPEVHASRAEIVACCLLRISFYGFTIEQHQNALQKEKECVGRYMRKMQTKNMKKKKRL